MDSQAATTPALISSLGGPAPVLAAALALASTISASLADTLVEIPDTALRECVEKALDREEGTQITQDDLEGLTALEGCTGVSHLDGLEFATNLTRLNLVRGKITNLSPISDISSLEELNLGSHRIRDLTPISGLVGLWTLSAFGNPVSDLAPLVGLQSLRELTLNDTQITDLSPLLGLPSLEYLSVVRAPIRDLPYWPPSASLRTLYIGGNGVRDLSPLTSLKTLTSLGLSEMDLRDFDFTPLRRLPSLNTLNLGFSYVDLEDLPEVRNLTDLLLRNSIIDGWSSLANHSSLRYLYIDGTGLQNLEIIPSSVLASLWDIGLDANRLTEIEPLLSNGGQLRWVSLLFNPWLSRKAVEVDIPALRARGVHVEYDTPAADAPDAAFVGDPALRLALTRTLIGYDGYGGGYIYDAAVPAGQLAEVRSLGLSKKGIASLQGMEHATSLTNLWLSDNDVSDISPLTDLPLNALALDGNPVGDLGPLLEMEDLIYLALDNASLHEVPPLPQRLLRYLFLADNSITDLGPLAWVGQSMAFMHLDLSGNSISSLRPLTGYIHFLHVNDNAVDDLAGLTVTGLRELHIRNNALRDISPLLDATSLWMLDAKRNPLGEEALTVAETLRKRGAAVLTGEPVPFLPAAGVVREGLVRIVNRGGEGGTVFIEAWDDAGVRFGPVRLRMDGQSAVHFTSTDLQSGKPSLGLAGIGPPTTGDWRLALTSPLDIEVLAYVRTADGFLTPMHDVAADATLPTLNPGSNSTRRSVLRLVNRDVERAQVVVGGYDDRGT